MGVKLTEQEDADILRRIEELRAEIERIHSVDGVGLSCERILRLSRQLDYLMNHCFSRQVAGKKARLGMNGRT